MDNMPNFGLDLPDDLESNELPFDTVCDYDCDYGTDEFTLDEDEFHKKLTSNPNNNERFGCGSNTCSYCHGKGFYWSCGENVTCIRCGGSGIGN